MLNSPLRYTDPSGHRECEDSANCSLGNSTPTSNGTGQPSNNHHGNDEAISLPLQNNVACGPGLYSPRCPGWHFYTLTHLICPAEFECSRQEIIEYLSRFAYPGQYAWDPVENTSLHPVGLGPFSVGSIDLGPYSVGSLGQIQTFVSNGGLTIKNVTQPGHIFYDGIVVRTAYQDDKGTWYLSTYGYGNNVNPGMDSVNQVFGPGFFNDLDRQMISTIEAHH